MIGTGAVAVLALYAVTAFCAESATALVLWRRAAVDESRAVGVLAVAYTVATVAIAVNAAALLGATALDPFGPVTWLWWHGLIPLGVLCAVRLGPGPMRAGTLAAAAALVT